MTSNNRAVFKEKKPYANKRLALLKMQSFYKIKTVKDWMHWSNYEINVFIVKQRPIVEFLIPRLLETKWSSTAKDIKSKFDFMDTIAHNEHDKKDRTF